MQYSEITLLENGPFQGKNTTDIGFEPRMGTDITCKC